ncbi:hypothetical protein BDZ89DRAFT_1158539 [Hymenopellis radicata]|nr:hypothetical protein BDZ89DRAFT_1158539 [Hymenopellis radicata]
MENDVEMNCLPDPTATSSPHSVSVEDFPTEILVALFAQCCNASTPCIISRHEDHRPWKQIRSILRRVCRRWRHIVDDFPTLWTDIRYYFSRQVTLEQNVALEAAIHHSKNFLLNVELLLEWTYSDRDAVIQSSAILDNVLSLLLSSSRRWRSLTLNVQCLQPATNVLSQLRGNLMGLAALSLHGILDRNIPEDCLAIFSDAHNLTSLEDDRTFERPLSIPSSGLRSLTWRDGSSVDLMQHISILWTLMDACTAANEHPLRHHHPDEAKLPILHKSVTSIITARCDVLDLLEAPLASHVEGDEWNLMHSASLLAFIHRSGCFITTLVITECTIAGMWMSSDAALVAALTTLNSLTLDYRNIDGPYFVDAAVRTCISEFVGALFVTPRRRIFPDLKDAVIIIGARRRYARPHMQTLGKMLDVVQSRIGSLKRLGIYCFTDSPVQLGSCPPQAVEDEDNRVPMLSESLPRFDALTALIHLSPPIVEIQINGKYAGDEAQPGTEVTVTVCTQDQEWVIAETNDGTYTIGTTGTLQLENRGR